MNKKLKPCPACGAQIAKGARACPSCGKSFTNMAGIALAVIIGLLVGWFMMARTCSTAAEADRELDQIEQELRRQR